MNSQRFCIVVPLYNHAAALPGTVRALLAHGLPIIIIDDGSDDGGAAAAGALQKSHEGIELVSFSENQGKGAAVMAGLQRAHSRGFTHAIQVDADGQHDLSALPRLVEASVNRPDALVSGRPRFDKSMPRGRRIGRWATHVWVWIETLSLEIQDTMCGFRIYPLQPCIDLFDRRRLGRRMDFDIEIAVRLHWKGIPFVPVDVRVEYPVGGRSHFRGLRDNALITRMHTRLVLEMLVTFPTILRRRRRAPAQHWATIGERGSALGMKLLLAMYRYGGRKICLLALYPLIVYFYLSGRQARRASEGYLHRLREHARKHGETFPDELGTFKHMRCFAEAALDKVAVWAGSFPMDAIEFADPGLAATIRDDARGAVYVGSHLGNLEVCRALAHTHADLALTALVFSRNAEKFNRLLARVNPSVTSRLVQVDSLSPEVVIQLKEAVEGGASLAIVADRTPIGGGQRTIRASFLGREAEFPIGPFILASLLECPVYTIFCLKHGAGYMVHIELLANPLHLPRQEREHVLRKVVRQYAERLERHCLAAPLQWFNFFDFWAAAQAQQGNGR